MRYLSLFSGIEAATVAWHPLGWECVGVAEIEPFPCAVLKHHYPDVPNLGSVTDITEEQVKALGHIDLVVFGSPCQDLSAAGHRKGLINADGTVTRSGLFFTAINIARWSGARFWLWENVPGAYSSNAGRDFAAVVEFMAGMDECPIPPKGWGTEGVAVGDNGLLEWACLDAQWFGVAQRRRRVFALADLGDWTSRPPILLEPEGVRGDSPPSREKGEGFAFSTPRGVEVSCFERHDQDSRIKPINVAPTMHSKSDNTCDLPIVMERPWESLCPQCGGEGAWLNDDCDKCGGSGVVRFLDGVAKPLLSGGNSNNPLDENLILSNDPATAICANEQRTYTNEGSVFQLRNVVAQATAVATFQQSSMKGRGTIGYDESGVAKPVKTQMDGQMVAVTQATAVGGDIAHTLKAEGFDASEDSAGRGTPTIAHAMQVRRLTPVECSRLQQFPDDYLETHYADADEAHSAQILHELWRSTGAKGIASEEACVKKNWGSDVCEEHRIAAALLTPEILLSGVHVGWIQWAQAEQYAKQKNLSMVGEGGWTEGFVRGLWEARSAGRSPYQRESFGQLARELGVPLSKLPLEATQARAFVRSSQLWPEAQRAWPLRYALATRSQVEKGRMNPDGPRYKALGNSMAVPVMAWIGKQIQRSVQ